MKTPVIPQTYAQWRHCIEVDCGLTLTPAFVDQRLAVWRSASHDESQRFARLYGAEHRLRVLHWFEQARSALA